MFGPHKAAGPDDIKPIVLQNLPDRFLEGLVRIYTACMKLGYTPKCWRTSTVSFLPKPNKVDWSNPQSFRPISLQKYLFKLLERIVKFHLKYEGALVKPMHEHQFAFQTGKSTDGAISRTVTELDRGTLLYCCILLYFWTSRGHLIISPMMPK